MDLDRLIAREPTPRAAVAHLSDIAASHTLRCDSRQWEPRFQRLDDYLHSVPCFELGDVLPDKIVKGKQPTYADNQDAEGVLVINTLSIRDLAIDTSSCRVALDYDFGESDMRRPRPGDVLLTLDGGTSIGKAVLFDLPEEYGIDSHVGILRPHSIDPALVVYLLASPLGQLQFQRAESGASGQTSVSDEDIRRFRFPLMSPEVSTRAVTAITEARARASALRNEAAAAESMGWEDFINALTDDS